MIIAREDLQAAVERVGLGLRGGACAVTPDPTKPHERWAGLHVPSPLWAGIVLWEYAALEGGRDALANPNDWARMEDALDEAEYEENPVPGSCLVWFPGWVLEEDAEKAEQRARHRRGLMKLVKERRRR